MDYNPDEALPTLKRLFSRAWDDLWDKRRKTIAECGVCDAEPGENMAILCEKGFVQRVRFQYRLTLEGVRETERLTGIELLHKK